MSNISLQTILHATHDLPTCVAAAEQTYREKIDSVVHELLCRGSRILMLAGPSSSGKTTTANMLSTRLQEAGHPAFVVSLDNFYRNPDDPAYPRTPDGHLDFETVDALEIDEIHACLEAIEAGRTYDMPRFDFRVGGRAGRIPLCVPPGGIVIVEGLHALNPRLTAGISGLWRLFISVSTNIIDESGACVLSGRRVRFLRRLVRDFFYRNSDAAYTYRLWQSVVAGEERYLYPFRGEADRQLDTFHLYEVGLLRHYAEKMLLSQEAPQNAYIDEVRAGMARFPEIAEVHVPETSLLREFIPGGVYESLY